MLVPRAALAFDEPAGEPAHAVAEHPEDEDREENFHLTSPL